MAKDSSTKVVGVILMIAAVIVGIVVFSDADLTQLAFVNVKVGDTEVEVGDISESSAVGLGVIAMIGLFTPGVILALKK